MKSVFKRHSSPAIDNLYVVILAGGQGARLWPLSRQTLPKQFLPLANKGMTLLQATVQRARRIAGSIEKILVVALETHSDLIQQQLPELPKHNIILEPLGRNTAASITLGASAIAQRSEKAVMLVLPSDHLFKNEDAWLEAVTCAIDTAHQQDKLVTIGISPLEPSPSYGYLNISDIVNYDNPCPVYQVNAFIEKPDRTIAQHFITSQQYLWNTGTFSWKMSVFLAALKRHCPDLHLLFNHATQTASDLRDIYVKLENISIDHALLEKVNNIVTIKGSFQRIDVGSLRALRQILSPDEDANVCHGQMITSDSHKNIVYTDQGLVGLVGVDDLIVVRNKEIVLVCAASQANEVKELIKQLEEQGMVQYK